MSITPLRCRICDSTRLNNKPFGYNFKDQWLGAVECASCGIIFIDPQPTAEEFRELYSAEYFEGDFRCGHEGSYFDEQTLNHLGDRDLLGRIMRYKKVGNFLEIGCAGGAFLNIAREAGYSVRGVEFSPDAARFASEKFGLDVHTGELESANFPAESFDVVFMGDVLEHLPNPVKTMREINRIMKPKGMVVILCPMQTNTLYSRLGFFGYSILGKKVTVHLPPYHVFEYRAGSMSALVKLCGFELLGKRESIIPPSRIAQRNSALQNFLKKAFQYPNSVLTKCFNRWGDRIELYAIKTDSMKI